VKHGAFNSYSNNSGSIGDENRLSGSKQLKFFKEEEIKHQHHKTTTHHVAYQQFPPQKDSAKSGGQQ